MEIKLETLILIEQYEDLVKFYGVYSFGAEEFKIRNINNLEFLYYAGIVDKNYQKSE